MGDKITQFVNNDCVNNTPQIINSYAIPSKNNATLASDRQNINADENNGNNGDILTIIIIIIIIVLNYFYHTIH
jgi:hypothetical protein